MPECYGHVSNSVVENDSPETQIICTALNSLPYSEWYSEAIVGVGGNGLMLGRLVLQRRVGDVSPQARGSRRNVPSEFHEPGETRAGRGFTRHDCFCAINIIPTTDVNTEGIEYGRAAYDGVAGV